VIVARFLRKKMIATNGDHIFPLIQKIVVEK